MYGVTIGKYREHFPNGTPAQLKRISMATAMQIYRKDFWLPVKGDTLSAGVDLATYDAAVNSGVSRARKWLYASVGERDEITVQRICAKRLSFVQALKIWKTFGKGWARRIADIEAKGVAWALEGKIAKPSVKIALNDKAQKAEDKAKNQGGGAVVTGTGSGATVANNADAIAGWVLGGMVFAAGALVAFLIVRSHINKQRAKAYAKEAAA